ncbi:hypothetical protein RND71_035351 [Anisodus tanguticus]|uniref:Uncharacterized protein n=1 Tax=Anisodus tanguticus TaxID=243964 RepID=A0AAE1V245_9SOLA|nr:hypothetical protein RND71_035351 [Anisodus tanguticus]
MIKKILGKLPRKPSKSSLSSSLNDSNHYEVSALNSNSNSYSKFRSYSGGVEFGDVEETSQGPQLIRRRWLHKASDAPLYIDGSFSLAHDPVHSHDPSSVALKATISLAEASDAGVAVEETAGDNPSAEAHPTDDSEVPAEIIPEDVRLRYFGSVEVASPPVSPVDIHRERVRESMSLSPG